MRKKRAIVKTGNGPATAVRAPSVRVEILQHLGMGLSDTAACEWVGIARSSFYKWIREDAEFAAEVMDARRAADDRVHDEIHRRAVRGVRRDVWYQGVKVGVERLYSDSLLIHRSRRTPEYQNIDNPTKRLELSGPGGGPIPVASLTAEQLLEELKARGLPILTIEE